MTGLSTLPSTRDQARHGLLLLGVPTSPRLLVDVHRALFDGDLSVPSLAALIRDEERAHPSGAPPSPARGADLSPADVVCPGLNLDLSPARGVVTLSSWPLTQRLHTPVTARAEILAAVVRVTEFVAARPGATTAHLLRHLATLVPGGPEALDVLNPSALADAARAALDALAAAVDAEAPARADAADRAATLPTRHQLFGVPAVPHQRGGA